MDFQLRQLERQASMGDPEAKELLYHRYRMLGPSHLDKLCALLSAEVTARSSGKNRGCFPLLSFDWKDADLEPEGCTGIKEISCTPESIQVTVGGHKTFAPDEDGLDDDGYMDAAHGTFADMTSGYEGNWSGDDWSSSYTNTIQVEYQPELSDTAIYLIEQAEADLLQYKEDMAIAHEAFYAVELSQPPEDEEDVIAEGNTFRHNPDLEIPAHLTPESLDEWSDAVKENLDLWIFHLFLLNNGDICLSSIIVKPDDLKGGKGTEAMERLAELADYHQKKIWLSPGEKDPHHKTTSRGRLIRFYKRFGFIQNKGRNKDYRCRETMYRRPLPRPFPPSPQR